MNSIEILGKLNIGFDINGRRFMPKVYLHMVDEPDFGCEGRDDNAPAYAELYGYDSTGEKKWLLEDKYLISSGYDDKMWLGSFEGENEICAVYDGTNQVKKIPDGPWLKLFQ